MSNYILQTIERNVAFSFFKRCQNALTHTRHIKIYQDLKAIHFSHSTPKIKITSMKDGLHPNCSLFICMNSKDIANLSPCGTDLQAFKTPHQICLKKKTKNAYWIRCYFLSFNASIQQLESLILISKFKVSTQPTVKTPWLVNYELYFGRYCNLHYSDCRYFFFVNQKHAYLFCVRRGKPSFALKFAPASMRSSTYMQKYEVHQNSNMCI